MWQMDMSLDKSPSIANNNYHKDTTLKWTIKRQKKSELSARTYIAARVLLVYFIVLFSVLLLTFNTLFFTDQSRAPSALVSTSMNAHMDSLGSVSTPSVFSGVSIGTVTNSPIQVKNEFHGNVNFVNNICRQNDKQDTDKD